MLGMFEQFHEFYGRTIELEVYVSTGLANDEVTARADAARIAEDFEPFVVLGTRQRVHRQAADRRQRRARWHRGVPVAAAELRPRLQLLQP